MLFYRLMPENDVLNILEGDGINGTPFCLKSCNNYDDTDLNIGDPVVYMFPYPLNDREETFLECLAADKDIEDGIREIDETIDLLKDASDDKDGDDVRLAYFYIPNDIAFDIMNKFSGIGQYGDDYEKITLLECAIPEDYLSPEEWLKALKFGERMKAKINSNEQDYESN